MTTSPLTILQITDVHLLGGQDEKLLGVDTADSLRVVLEQAFAEATPDAVLATGDIAHHGDPRAYRRFTALLDAHHRGPRLVLPGNHDISAAMAPLLSSPPVLSLPGWEVIGFDSHQDNSVGADVSAQDREQLEAACLAAAAAGKNVLLATHHPPLDVNCPWLDKDRIQNGAELLEWLSEHTTVCAMVFGHAHQVIEQQAGATRRISLHGTPSTCFQFAPETRTFTIDEAEPGYRWLELHADAEVTTRVRRVHYPMQIELPGRQA